jgi:hypothetical protein
LGLFSIINYQLSIKLNVMNISIIKKENLMEVVSVEPSNRGDTNVSRKFPYSSVSVTLRRGNADNVVEISVYDRVEYRVALSDVTVQSGDDAPVQATLANWDELTDDLIKSVGGAGGEEMEELDERISKVEDGENTIPLFDDASDVSLPGSGTVVGTFQRIRNNLKWLMEKAAELGNRNIYSGDVTGATTLDLALYNTFILTMTGNTTFSFDNLTAVNKSVTVCIDLTGAFTWTLPSGFDKLKSEDYNGAVVNSIFIDIRNVAGVISAKYTINRLA